MTRQQIRKLGKLVPLLGLALPAAPALGQMPVPPTGPVQVGACCPPGPLHRIAHHFKHKLKDKLIGYPEYFAEPPLGTNLREINGLMTAAADPHALLLYRSDFRQGTTSLSPGGAERLSRMAREMPRSLGPLVVEWTPEQPELAEQRRLAVVDLLQRAGLPCGPDQVVVAPSPFRGMLGDDAAVSYPVMIDRDARAGASYPVPPIPVSLPGAGGVQ
jgi:hypothetical protein